MGAARDPEERRLDNGRKMVATSALMGAWKETWK